MQFLFLFFPFFHHELLVVLFRNHDKIIIETSIFLEVLELIGHHNKAPSFNQRKIYERTYFDTSMNSLP